MAAIIDRPISNPILLPDIVACVLDWVLMVSDLLNCACVHSTWSTLALKKLYKGSLSDMQFRTPDIASLNCLFAASRERFARNMSFVQHLLLSPETPSIDQASHEQDPSPYTMVSGYEDCRPLRNRQSAKLLLRPKGNGPTSLSIPFKMVHQDWSLISDLIISPTIKYLAIDNRYCEFLMTGTGNSQELITPAVSFVTYRRISRFA
jgi:hypothetical protein